MAGPAGGSPWTGLSWGPRFHLRAALRRDADRVPRLQAAIRHSDSDRASSRRRVCRFDVRSIFSAQRICRASVRAAPMVQIALTLMLAASLAWLWQAMRHSNSRPRRWRQEACSPAPGSRLRPCRARDCESRLPQFRDQPGGPSLDHAAAVARHRRPDRGAAWLGEIAGVRLFHIRVRCGIAKDPLPKCAQSHKCDPVSSAAWESFLRRCSAAEVFDFSSAGPCDTFASVSFFSRLVG